MTGSDSGNDSWRIVNPTNKKETVIQQKSKSLCVQLHMLATGWIAPYAWQETRATVWRIVVIDQKKDQSFDSFLPPPWEGHEDLGRLQDREREVGEIRFKQCICFIFNSCICLVLAHPLRSNTHHLLCMITVTQGRPKREMKWILRPVASKTFWSDVSVCHDGFRNRKGARKGMDWRPIGMIM